MTLVADIYPGSSGSNPLSLTVFNNALYFMASDTTGNGLWKYDGTNVSRAGTMVLNSINSLLVYNGALYFGAAASGMDFEPWKYDGTNFSFLGEVNTNHTNASPLFWTTFRNLAFFSAVDGVHGTGYQLWSCDGSNLTRLSDFATGGIYQFVFNNTLYFMANDGITGYEPWKYDGSTISQVADINPGYLDSFPEPLSAFNNTYLFQATDGLHGTELWRLDALSNVFRITSIAKQGGDVLVGLTAPAGWTNVLQAANGVAGPGQFTDLSPPVIAAGNGITSTNFLDVGGAGHSARYYRLRKGP
jgi:ELWxxDGT repeat protein